MFLTLRAYRKLMKCVRFALKKLKAVAAATFTKTDDIEILLKKASIHFAQLQFSQLKWDGKIEWIGMNSMLHTKLPDEAFVVRFGTCRIQRKHAMQIRCRCRCYCILFIYTLRWCQCPHHVQTFFRRKNQLAKLEHCLVNWRLLLPECVLFEFMASRNPVESQYPIEMFRMKCTKTNTPTTRTYCECFVLSKVWMI